MSHLLKVSCRHPIFCQSGVSQGLGDAERIVALRIITRRFGYLPAMVYDYDPPGAQ